MGVWVQGAVCTPLPRSPLTISPSPPLRSSSLPLQVFDKPPEGSRKVILATNIAETSITISGVR